MTKNVKRTIAIAVIMFVVFSVIAFAIPFKKNGIYWLAYIFGVFAIAIQLYVLKIAFNNADTVKSKFYGFPIARIGLIYMAVQIVLSIIFMALAKIAPLWVEILIFVIAAAAGALGLIGADATKEEIERQDVKLVTDTSCMTTLRSIVYSLPDRCRDENVRAELKKLADEFRYSDPVSGTETYEAERELEMSVSGLQEAVLSGDGEKISEICRKTKDLLLERNRICKLSKK